MAQLTLVAVNRMGVLAEVAHERLAPHGVVGREVGAFLCMRHRERARGASQYPGDLATEAGLQDCPSAVTLLGPGRHDARQPVIPARE